MVVRQLCIASLISMKYENKTKAVNIKDVSPKFLKTWGFSPDTFPELESTRKGYVSLVSY